MSPAMFALSVMNEFCFSTSKPQDTKKASGIFNVFSNDGSFLDQFRQMKEKKLDQKLKSFKRDSQERLYGYVVAVSSIQN